jgi:hypothetical protein
MPETNALYALSHSYLELRCLQAFSFLFSLLAAFLAFLVVMVIYLLGREINSWRESIGGKGAPMIPRTG